MTKDRTDAGFFDNGLWEKKQRENDESIKQLIRDGISGTSVVCVLNGTMTYSRPWVRYEVVRGILNKNGILTVDIHGVKNLDQQTSMRGPDPLDSLGLYRANGSVYFCEYINGGWAKYGNYGLAVDEKLLWFGAPRTTDVVRLSSHFGRFDFAAQNGRTNLGDWIEDAASAAGR